MYRHGTAGFPAVLLGLAVMAGGAMFLAVGALASVKGVLGGGLEMLGGGLATCLFFVGVIAAGRFLFRLGVRANRPMWCR